MARCTGIIFYHTPLIELFICRQSLAWYHLMKFPEFVPDVQEYLTEWQRHICSYLLDTKPLWHWGKWKSWLANKREAWPWYRPSGMCSLHRFEATCQFLHPVIGSSQMACGWAWPRSLSLKANTGTTQEIQALNQSWGGCNHPTLNWPYQGQQVPYLVSWAPDCLPELWSDTDHWPYAPRVCGIAGKLWWILHS